MMQNKMGMMLRVKIFNSILAVILSACCTGCATVLSGSRQEVSVRSNPPGAAIHINGKNFGTTPKTVLMKRKTKERTIVLMLDGYEDYKTTTYRKLNGVVFGNIIIGGLIGLGIDALTGAIHNIKPEIIEAELQKKNY